MIIFFYSDLITNDVSPLSEAKTNRATVENSFKVMKLQFFFLNIILSSSY